MKTKYFLLISLFLLGIDPEYSQTMSKTYKSYQGLFLECNTYVISHNLKLYTEMDFYKSDYITLSLQPGSEFIFGLSGTKRSLYTNNPYYDVNLLLASQIFPLLKISLKPFGGIIYRTKSTNESFLDVKCGVYINFFLSSNWDIIIKYMNITVKHNDDLPILFGIGFSVKLF